MSRIYLAPLEDLLRSDLSHLRFGREDGFKGKRLETYVAGRRLLSFALGVYAKGFTSLPPLLTGEHGKPYFAGPIHFNLSHSGSLVALSVGDYPQGVDVEMTRPRRRLEELIQKTLSQGEQDYLLALDPDTRLKEFARSWTLRECLIKASGLGLVGLNGLKVRWQDRHVEARDNVKGRVLSLRLTDLEDAGVTLSPGFLSFFEDARDGEGVSFAYVSADAHGHLKAECLLAPWLEPFTVNAEA